MSFPIHDANVFIPGLGDGAPGNLTLPGSGVAVPAGLEAVIEFNQLFLNVQKNVDWYRITSIDGLSDPDIRDTRDVNTDDDGETPYHSFYGGRTIVIAGRIETYSVAKLRDMQMALKSAFRDIRKESSLIFHVANPANNHFINCKKSAPIAGIEQQQSQQIIRDFQITLRASNPRFLNVSPKTLDVTLPNTPTYTQIGVAANAGTYEAQPIFRVYGPASAASIKNEVTGASFTLGTIASNDFVDFNMATKSLVNSIGLNQWKILADDSSYVYFEPGNNTILYHGDASRIAMTWNDTWI